MTYIVMSPYIPTAYNTYTRYSKKSELRIVEPTSKTSSNIYALVTEKLYDNKGLKELNAQGSLIDFYI